MSKPIYGMSGTRIYKTWTEMNYRCYNPNCKAYKNYGGRGIKVCKRWRNSFENFCADMGDKPKGLTLERINNDRNYEPGNCKWATYKENLNNRRPMSCGPMKQRWFRAWHKDMMCQFISNNQSEFARKHKLVSPDISACLHGRRKHHHNWRFQWIEK